MIKRWFYPSWSGDFRLEAAEADANASVLTIVNPTLSERSMLEEFLLKCYARGWVKPVDGAVRITAEGETRLELSAGVIEAGQVLLGDKAPREGVITAVKSSDGTVEAVLGLGEAKAAEVEQKLAKPEAEAAVTTRRPTLCCPDPVPGPDVRASDVLHAFCSPAQWREWQQHGFLHAVGRDSGHLYRIAHRHTALARAQGYIAWDVTGDSVVHCYDWSVPPAEEVLAVKHALEHAEHWVRNKSALLMSDDTIMVNPFMAPDSQLADGTVDSGVVRGLGLFLRALTGAVVTDDDDNDLETLEVVFNPPRPRPRRPS